MSVSPTSSTGRLPKWDWQQSQTGCQHALSGLSWLTCWTEFASVPLCWMLLRCAAVCSCPLVPNCAAGWLAACASCCCMCVCSRWCRLPAINYLDRFPKTRCCVGCAHLSDGPCDALLHALVGCVCVSNSTAGWVRKVQLPVYRSKGWALLA
jgi:hypothetical protein